MRGQKTGIVDPLTFVEKRGGKFCRVALLVETRQIKKRPCPEKHLGALKSKPTEWK